MPPVPCVLHVNREGYVAEGPYIVVLATTDTPVATLSPPPTSIPSQVGENLATPSAPPRALSTKGPKDQVCDKWERLSVKGEASVEVVHHGVHITTGVPDAEELYKVHGKVPIKSVNGVIKGGFKHNKSICGS